MEKTTTITLTAPERVAAAVLSAAGTGLHNYMPHSQLRILAAAKAVLEELEKTNDELPPELAGTPLVTMDQLNLLGAVAGAEGYMAVAPGRHAQRMNEHYIPLIRRAMERLFPSLSGIPSPTALELPQ